MADEIVEGEPARLSWRVEPLRKSWEEVEGFFKDVQRTIT